MWATWICSRLCGLLAGGDHPLVDMPDFLGVSGMLWAVALWAAGDADAASPACQPEDAIAPREGYQGDRDPKLYK